VQGPLGTAEDFNLAHIEQRSNGAQAAKIDVINHKSNGGIEWLLKLASFADTANLVVTGSRGTAGEVDIWGNI